MNGNRTFVPFAILVGVLISSYATMSILLSGGNTIGEFCRYLLVGGFLISLLQPRLGFFLWFFACGYNDLLKRFLVIGGRISWSDLPYVLGIAPVMFGGVVLSLFLGALTGSRTVTPREWKMFFAGGLLMAVSGVTSYLGEGNSMGAMLQALANDGLYAMLLFVVPVLFKSVDDLLLAFRRLTWIFVPVAIYGIAQQLNGFQDFEIAYLRTGMSIEIKQLFTNQIRAFSTLNSPTAFATVSAAFCALCLLLMSRRSEATSKRLMNPLLAMSLAALFFAGWLASTGRAAIVIVPLALIGTWAFQRAARTFTLYVAASLGFVSLVLSSQLMLDHLDGVNQTIAQHVESSSYGGSMLTVGTYSDRLSGFAEVLLNTKAWSLFGRGASRDDFRYHDPLSALLLRTGVVGFVVVLSLVGLVLNRAHRKLYEMHDPELRWLAAMFQALAMGILFTSLLSGWILSVFPINVFFWFCWGGVVLVMSLDSKTLPDQATQDVGLPAPISASPRKRMPPLVKSIPAALR